MARDVDEALVLLLGRCAGEGDGLPEGRYPVWADDRGRWQTGGPDHWAAGFATGAQALAEVCGVPVRGPALRPVVPDDVDVSSFHAYTGWYAGHLDARAGKSGREAARIAARLEAALLPGGALAVTEHDLRGPAGHAVAYVDAVGPAAALLAATSGPRSALGTRDGRSRRCSDRTGRSSRRRGSTRPPGRRGRSTPPRKASPVPRDGPEPRRGDCWGLRWHRPTVW